MFILGNKRNAESPPPLKPSETQMPEAEVTLRLAFWLLDSVETSAHIEIALDGAHIKIAAHKQAGRDIPERTVFPIVEFLRENGCVPESLREDGWRGLYRRKNGSIHIQSVAGFDLQANLNGQSIKVECKGSGKFINPIFYTAIGQAITAETAQPHDELWVAVPNTPAFLRVGTRVASSPKFPLTGIRIVLVGQDGAVQFLN